MLTPLVAIGVRLQWPLSHEGTPSPSFLDIIYYQSYHTPSFLYTEIITLRFLVLMTNPGVKVKLDRRTERPGRSRDGGFLVFCGTRHEGWGAFSYELATG